VSGSSDTATCALGANQSAIKRGWRLPFSLLLVAIVFGTAILYTGGGTELRTSQTRSHAQWAHLYAALPLSFEANRGQTNPNVDFVSRGQGYTLFLTGHESVLTLKSAAGRNTQSAHTTALRLQLLGANTRATVTGTDELPGKANYFIGKDPSKWHTNIPTYAKVRYEDVYPGVDLVYYGTQGGQLEYDFVVAPGANPGVIGLNVQADSALPASGGKSSATPALQLTPNGDLLVKLDTGDVRFHKPVLYQEQSTVDSSMSTVHDGNRTAASNLKSKIHNRKFVDGQYVLRADNRVGFQVADYDHSRPLVIDPELIYATYVGGNGGDIGYGIAVDANLDAYIAGVTNSTNFPTIGSPYQSSSHGAGDAFVAKINSAGTNLLYSTYLGGSGSDTATAIAVFAESVFVTGNTTSTDFPVVSPITNTTPFQDTYGGNTDAFVSQLAATGSSLVYSSYLGGSGADFGQGIAVDSSGNAYVTGSTQSGNFPIVGAYQPGNNGSSDAFVTKVNVTGTALVYSTYLGGTSADVGQSIQVDTSGDAYVAGYTFSSNFPLVDPFQSTIGGGADAFVAEFNPAGSALIFSTFVGGSGDDRAYGLALDGTKNVYIAGATVSTNFPTTSGAFQTTLKGSSDAFVSKLSPTGSSLLYSTYLGGSGIDQANGIAVTSGGVVDVTGFTESSDFPTQAPVQSVLGLSNNQLCGSLPCADAFVTQFNSAGTALTYSTYLGGNGPDFGQAIALDGTGDPYITGSTSSTNFPAIAGSYKSTLTGTAGNAFIAKLDPVNNSNLSIVPYTVAFASETLSVTSPYQQITIANMSTAPITITSILVNPVGTSNTVFTETDNCLGGSIPAGGAFCTMNVAFTPASTGQVTDTIVLTDNAGAIPGTQQTITLTGTGSTAATAVTVSPTSLSFPSQPVGTTSAAQNVQVTNTGSQTLSISKISAGTTLDFPETDNCLTAPYFGSLAVSQSCNVSVFFTPTASGTRTSSLSISDNATGSPQAVALTGVGAAAFTITSPSASNPVLIGSTQTTFNLLASQPNNGTFNGTISLACSAGATCAFNPTTIFAGNSTSNGGDSSVLTISNLSPSTPNPYQFSATGTSGTQTSTVNLSLLFEDFTLTASPPIYTAQAGTPGKYTILVNPLYTFNSAVQLECLSVGLPPDATCAFGSNGAATIVVTPGPSTPASVPLSINTVKYVAPTNALPRFPGGRLPPLILGLLTLAALASLAFGKKRGAQRGWLTLRLALLTVIMALDLALVACRPNTLLISGTTTGDYTITIQGTLNANTAVIRTTTLNLAVTATAP
jgi:hypothetical protein